MTKDKLTLSKKVALLFFITSFFIHNSSYSQCANPTPTGNVAQSFCVADYPTVDDLVVSPGTSVWYDAPTGGNQYIGTAPLEDGETYYADDLTSNVGGSCSVSRLAVTVTLNGFGPADFILVGKCQSSDPTLGDISITGTDIKWFDAIINGNELPLSTSLVDGTVYYVQQTENGCISLRDPIVVLVEDPLPPVIDTIQSFCSPATPALDPTISDLTGTGHNIIWYDSETSSTPLDPSTPLVNGEDYWGAQSSTAFPCESTVRAQTTVEIDTTPIAGTSGSYTECEIDVVTTDLFTLLIGTPDTTGTWSSPDANPLGGGYLGTYDPAINTPGTFTYTVNSLLGVCPSASADVVVTITQIPPPTVTNTNQSYCEIDGATVAELVATGTSLLWYDTETSITALNSTDLLLDGEDYWASQTDVATSGCESASRVAVTVTINMPPPPTTTEVNQSFCEIDGSTIADLDVTGTTVIWYDTDISTAPLTSTDLLVDGQDYWASQTDVTSGCESASRLVINVTVVMPLPPTTTETNQAFCEIDNSTIADLSVVGTGIIWYDTETDTVPIDPATALIDSEDYWATQTDVTSGCESLTRLMVNVVINAPVPPTTSEANQAFCEIDGATVANLNATGTGILWYATETDSTPLNSTDLLINGEDYWASQTDVTSGCESASRLVVTVVIQTPPPPTVSEVNQAFCDIDNATIAELIATGTSLVWYDTEISTTALATTDALLDGEDYWASDIDATSGCESATRVVINVTINIPLPPTTSNTTQSFCEVEGVTVADLSATGNTIQWYDTDISTTALNTTDLLTDGEDYWASQTDPVSGCESSTRIMVTVSLTTPPPPTTTEVNQTFCEIDGATIAELNATGNNIVWYASETDTTPLDSADILIDTEDYWASQSDITSGCESVTRLVITVTITVIPPPTTNSADQAFCLNDYLPGNPTINDLNISGANVVWYDSATSTTPLLLTDAIIDGEDYWASDADVSSGCESATRTVVNVTVVNLPAPTTSNSSQSFCLVLDATIGDIQASGTNIIWYDTDISTVPLNTSDLLIDGEDYWATQSDDTINCESLNRLMVTISIIDVVPPVISITSQSFCASDQPMASNIDVTGANIVWYADEMDTTPLNASDLLVDGEDYWAAENDTGTGCESSVRVVVTITLTDPGTPTITSLGSEFCKIEKPTVSDLNDKVSSANGGSITWYDSFPNGNEVFLSESLEEGVTYYAVETDGTNCSSTAPLAVTVTLEACDAYDIEVYDGFSPNGDGRNETFTITNLKDLYPNYNVEFFNRWGATVYTANANKPDWDGRLNGNGELVPAGVYYVIINFNDPDKKPIQKRLYLSR